MHVKYALRQESQNTEKMGWGRCPKDRWPREGPTLGEVQGASYIRLHPSDIKKL